MRELDEPLSARGRIVKWGTVPRGRWVELTRGIDFEQEPQTAGQALRAWARRNNLIARTLRDNDHPDALYVLIEDVAE